MGFYKKATSPLSSESAERKQKTVPSTMHSAWSRTHTPNWPSSLSPVKSGSLSAHTYQQASPFFNFTPLGSSHLILCSTLQNPPGEGLFELCISSLVILSSKPFFPHHSTKIALARSSMTSPLPNPIVISVFVSVSSWPNSSRAETMEHAWA